MPENCVKCTLDYQWVTESTRVLFSYASSERRLKDRLKYKRTEFALKRSEDATEDAQKDF